MSTYPSSFILKGRHKERPRCRKSNNIMVEFVEIEVVNIQFTEIGQVIIELYYNIELIERKTCMIILFDFMHLPHFIVGKIK